MHPHAAPKPREPSGASARALVQLPRAHGAHAARAQVDERQFAVPEPRFRRLSRRRALPSDRVPVVARARLHRRLERVGGGRRRRRRRRFARAGRCQSALNVAQQIVRLQNE